MKLYNIRLTEELSYALKKAGAEKVREVLHREFGVAPPETVGRARKKPVAAPDERPVEEPPFEAEVAEETPFEPVLQEPAPKPAPRPIDLAVPEGAPVPPWVKRLEESRAKIASKAKPITSFGGVRVEE